MEVEEGVWIWPTSKLRSLLSTVGKNLAPLLSQTTREPLMNSSFRSSWHRFVGCETMLIENLVKPACLQCSSLCSA